MTRADKRARQKERSRQAREAREAALKRERRKSTALRVGVGAVVVAGLIGVTALISNNRSNNKAAAATTTTSSTPPTTAAPVALPAGCTKAKPPENPNRPKSFKSAPPMTIDKTKVYTAQMSTSCGAITIHLDAANAPVSVNNFVFLAKQGFFDGLQWPRAARDFVIQSGSPDNTQAGGPGYSVKSEVPKKPGYAPGAVAWAKSGSEPAGTAGSQFFIVTGNGGASLPADYGTIGTVTVGLDAAQKIASLAPTSGDGPPTIPMYINKVTITAS